MPFRTPCQDFSQKTMNESMRENDSAGTPVADGCAYPSLDSRHIGPPHVSVLYQKWPVVDDAMGGINTVLMVNLSHP